MSQQSFGKYQLLRKLATGGMAEVWLARQTGIEGFQRQLVIKRILPHLAEDHEFVQMFLNEAKISAKFSHPNIGQIYDLGAVDGTYFIAMEYIHGEDLGRLMRKAWSTGQWIARPLAMRIVASACEGLFYAHTRQDERGQPLKVVHRDISPQNILISFDGSVKVVDFGIAKAANHTSMTKSGAIKGKFAYMSPEQAAGKNLDHRSDIFAIGLVLYELLTGVRPLKRESELATLQAALECGIEAPSQVADVPAELDSVVMRALAKDVGERYDDARQFQLALEEFLVSQRWVAGSVQIAELMSTLFADRLQEEAKASTSDEIPELSGATDQASGAPRSSPEMSWDAPPGDMQERRRVPRTINHSNASKVVAPNVPGWDAPAGEIEPQVAKRRVSLDNVRGSEAGTNVERTPGGSRTDYTHQAPRRTGGTGQSAVVSQVSASALVQPASSTELPPPPLAGETRARPATSSALSRAPYSSANVVVPTRGTGAQPPPQALLDDADAYSSDEGLQPPRRRTRSSTGWRRPTGVEMPEAPPPSSSRRVDIDEVIDTPSAFRGVRTGRDRLKSLGNALVVVALVAAGAAGIYYAANKGVVSGLMDRFKPTGNAPGLFLSVDSNLPMHVLVKHNEPNPPEAISELGDAPITKMAGAHVGDTVILENHKLAAHYQETLEFGEPGQVKVIKKNFDTGKVLPQLQNVPAGAQLYFYVEGFQVAQYQPNLSFTVVEGDYQMEIRGDVLREPIPITVKVQANKTTKTIPVDVRRNLAQL